MLSEQGYKKLQVAIDGDEHLKHHAETDFGFGADEFFVAILGTPSVTEPWLLQFGGHHFAYNITIVGDQMIQTPSFIGCEPCLPTGEFDQSSLTDEIEKGFALLNALDATQQTTAIFQYDSLNTLLSPAQTYREVPPQGVVGADLSAKQKALLLDIISQWVFNLNEASASAELAEIEATLDETYFAWSGSTTPGGGIYYRIDGPDVWIEFVHSGNDAPSVGHIHSIYRDPQNDYGKATVAEVDPALADSIQVTRTNGLFTLQNLLIALAVLIVVSLLVVLWRRRQVLDR